MTLPGQFSAILELYPIITEKMLKMYFAPHVRLAGQTVGLNIMCSGKFVVFSIKLQAVMDLAEAEDNLEICVLEMPLISGKLLI